MLWMVGDPPGSTLNVRPEFYGNFFNKGHRCQQSWFELQCPSRLIVRGPPLSKRVDTWSLKEKPVMQWLCFPLFMYCLYNLSDIRKTLEQWGHSESISMGNDTKKTLRQYICKNDKNIEIWNISSKPKIQYFTYAMILCSSHEPVRNIYFMFYILGHISTIIAT